MLAAQVQRPPQQWRLQGLPCSAPRASPTLARRAPRTQALPDLLPQLPQTSADIAAYVGLGLAAASFCGTFFVAPQFKSSFKENIDWMQIYAELVGQGVSSVEPEEAWSRRRRSVLLDVRLSAKYAAAHPEGALGVPLYTPIQKWDLASNIRRAAFAFFAVAGTEFNKAFVAQMEASGAPKSREVLVMCEGGGSLENKSGTAFGFQSQSLKAVFYLRRAGYTNVVHVKGGFLQWQRSGLPVESAESGVVQQEGQLETVKSL